jgi:hypothetical protein
MFDFSSILASVFTGLQDVFAQGIVTFITAALANLFPDVFGAS